MRPILKYLSALGLLCFAAYLIAAGSKGNLGVVRKSAIALEARKLDDRSMSHSKPGLRDIKISRRPSEQNLPFQGLSEPASGGIPSFSPQRKSPTPPSRAIRLGNDVRLPAALMHQTSVTTATPEIAAASRGIIDSFYQELSAVSSAGQADSSKVEEDGTRIIPAGIDADKARNRADEAYRALHGNEAFNRHSLQSALEVRLPVVSE